MATLRFPVSISAAFGQDVSVLCTPSAGSAPAASAGDFTNGFAASRVTIPAGQTSAFFDMPVKPNTTYEGNRNVKVTISDPLPAGVTLASGATVGTGTILEDDAQGGGSSLTDHGPVTYVAPRSLTGRTVRMEVDFPALTAGDRRARFIVRSTAGEAELSILLARHEDGTNKLYLHGTVAGENPRRTWGFNPDPVLPAAAFTAALTCDADNRIVLTAGFESDGTTPRVLTDLPVNSQNLLFGREGITPVYGNLFGMQSVNGDDSNNSSGALAMPMRSGVVA